MAVDYEYKCVAGPTQLTVKSLKDTEKAVASYANLINGAATDGWEFYSLENIEVAQASGCSLVPSKVPPVVLYMLVFRREIEEDE